MVHRSLLECLVWGTRSGQDAAAAIAASLGADELLFLADVPGVLEDGVALRGVDTTGIAPMAHPVDATQSLRADVVTESDRRDDYQRIAPAVQDGCYLVPRVVE